MMTRVARKSDVASTFFRVDGADLETGEETYLVLQAPTKPQAEKLARKQGLLISSVRVARPDDWHAPVTEAAEEPPAAPSAVEMDASPVPATAPEADGLDAAPSLPPPVEQAIGMGTESSPYRAARPDESEAFVDVLPAAAEPLPEDPAEPTAVSAAGIEPSGAPAPDGGSSAAAVVLGCVGAALVIGGALALTLALWPDNAVRNELQQIDYRLHEVSQTILGGMLVLSGMMSFTLAIICYLLRKQTARA
jgi:hypothetical protein